MTEARFGFLPRASTFSFDGGLIEPLPIFQEALRQIEPLVKSDGFLYPLLCQGHARDTNEPIPRTKRPALLRRHYVSHILRLDQALSSEQFSVEDGAFLLFLLSYVFGTRLAFEHWMIDGRVPWRPQHNIFAKEWHIDRFLSCCYPQWQSWKREDRLLATNILHMHSRAAMYEWLWERYIIEYMTLDACWRLACNVGLVRPSDAKRHGERLLTLCSRFGIPVDGEHGDRISRIVSVRNDLFHEALWGGDLPGAAHKPEENECVRGLRSIINRLIPALFSCPMDYTKTSWLSCGTHEFK